jgi:hypothetical protein
MSEAHARSWWADVEHLREAAERRSAERAKARIEGRDPVALTPLRPLHAVDGLAAFDEALDAIQPVAPGEAPRLRRFARDTAAAQPEPRASLTLVKDRDEIDRDSVSRLREPAPTGRFARRGDQIAPRPRPLVPHRRPASVPANDPDPRRRTVEIRGTVNPLPVELVPDPANGVGPARRRPKRRPAERFAGSPDRVAGYAVLLGVFLIVVALLSAHGG